MCSISRYKHWRATIEIISTHFFRLSCGSGVTVHYRKQIYGLCYSNFVLIDCVDAGISLAQLKRKKGSDDTPIYRVNAIQSIRIAVTRNTVF